MSDKVSASTGVLVGWAEGLSPDARLRFVEAAWDDAMEKASELVMALRYLPHRTKAIVGAADAAELIENELEVEWQRVKGGFDERQED